MNARRAVFTRFAWPATIQIQLVGTAISGAREGARNKRRRISHAHHVVVDGIKGGLAAWLVGAAVGQRHAFVVAVVVGLQVWYRAHKLDIWRRTKTEPGEANGDSSVCRECCLAKEMPRGLRDKTAKEDSGNSRPKGFRSRGFPSHRRLLRGVFSTVIWLGAAPLEGVCQSQPATEKGFKLRHPAASLQLIAHVGVQSLCRRTGHTAGSTQRQEHDQHRCCTTHVGET